MGFFDGGGKAVKFDVVNQGAGGYIVGQWNQALGREVPYLESQQTDFTTKEPKVYKDGNPVMQATVVLQTEERLDSDDDGQRTVYVNKTRMKKAIQKALKIAGAPDLEIGSWLSIWMSGQEVSTSGSPAKLFEANYVRATGSLAPETPVGVALEKPAAAPVAAPPAPPVVAPPAAPPAPPAAPPAAPAAVAAPPAPPVAAPPAAPVAPPAAPPSAPYTPPAPAAPPAAPAASPVAPPAAPTGTPLPF